MSFTRSTYRSADFAVYFLNDVLSLPIQKKRQTGQWPRVDEETRYTLNAVFNSGNAHENGPLLNRLAEKWHLTNFPQNPVAIDDGHHLQPFYQWTYRITLELLARNISTEGFEKYAALVRENLRNEVGAKFGVRQILAYIPSTVDTDLDKGWLSTTALQLAKLFEAEAALAEKSQSKTFAAARAPELETQARECYRLAFYLAHQIKTGEMREQCLQLFKKHYAAPDSANALEGLRTIGVVLSSAGEHNAALRELAECEKLASSPQFAHLATKTFKLKLYTVLADTAREMDFEQQATRAQNCYTAILDQPWPDEPEFFEGATSAVSDLCVAGDYARAKRYSSRIQEFFKTHESRFAKPHAALIEAEIVRFNGDPQKAKRLQDNAIGEISKLVEPVHVFWIIAKRLQAHVAEDLGDIQGAKRLYEEALAVKTKLMGPHVPQAILQNDYNAFLNRHGLR